MYGRLPSRLWTLDGSRRNCFFGGAADRNALCGDTFSLISKHVAGSRTVCFGDIVLA